MTFISRTGVCGAVLLPACFALGCGGGAGVIEAE